VTTDIQDKELDLLCDLVIMKIQEAIEATERAIAKTERTIEQLEISEKARPVCD